MMKDHISSSQVNKKAAYFNFPTTHDRAPGVIGLNGNLFAFTATIAVLIAAFFPVVQFDYLYHDDWMHVIASPMKSWFDIMGRQLGYLILHHEFSVVHSISDGRFGRGLVVLTLLATFAAIYCFIRREGLPTAVALLIGVCISTLPGFMVAAAWLGSGYIVCSILIATLAALICQYALQWSLRSPTAYVLLVLSIGAEIASNFIYQTGSMFFLVLAGIAAAVAYRCSWQELVRRWTGYGAVAFLANGGYLIWYRWLSPYGSQLGATNPERGNFLADFPLGALRWFWDLELPRGLHLWFIDGPTIIPSIVGFVWIATLFWFVIAQRQRSIAVGASALLAIAYILANATFVLCAVSPMLISGMRLEIYRSLIALSAIFVAFPITHVWFSLSGNDRLRDLFSRICFPIIAVLCVAVHGVLTVDFIIPNVAEVSFIRGSIKDATRHNEGMWPIQLIVPPIVHSSRTDEKGPLTANASPTESQVMLRVIRQDLGVPLVPVSVSAPGIAFDAKGKLVIDLTPLAKVGLWRDLQ